MSRIAASSDVFRAIADPTRRSILDSLRTQDQTASDLADGFSMTREAVSQHLKTLRDAQLIRSQSSGRYRVYSINPQGLFDVYQWVANYSAFWDDKLDRLEQELASSGQHRKRSSQRASKKKGR